MKEADVRREYNQLRVTRPYLPDYSSLTNREISRLVKKLYDLEYLLGDFYRDRKDRGR